MTDNSEIKGLIALLQGLYSRLAQAVVGIRQAGHRKGSVSGPGPDLSTLLSQQVERLAQASNGSHDERRPHVPVMLEEVKETASPQPSSSDERREQPIVMEEEDQSAGELGSHFHESQVDNFAHSSVSDNIKHRVLEHVNNALRHARSGDHKAAKINAIRTRSLIERADIVVVRFGDKYRQWNAAFDAGYAAALGKPLVCLHDPALTHALKEVDAAALAVAHSPNQVVDVLEYVLRAR